MTDSLNGLVEEVDFSGIGAPHAPRGEVQQSAAEWVRTADGALLSAQAFVPRERPTAAVVLAGATAVPSRYYKAFATALAREGFAVMTFDYRGVGRSREAHPAPDMRGWFEDINAVVSLVAERYAGLPVLYVGHSFGGHALGVSRAVATHVRAAVSVASMSGWVGHWPMPARLKIEALWRVAVPFFAGTLGYVPGWAGLQEDLPGGVARDWAGWCLTPGYFRGALEAETAQFDTLAVPILFQNYSDDAYAPAAAVEEFVGWFRSATITREVLEPKRHGLSSIGHFGFFREKNAALWGPVIAWLKAQR
ncbi:MAG: alpha/beta fold hydrolase [Myxococcales bacterium]|nr:alpha/beta fold hydrolase [Myxococcales bacterium]